MNQLDSTQFPGSNGYFILRMSYSLENEELSEKISTHSIAIFV